MNLQMQMDEMAKNIAMRAMDEYTYKGKTLREWIGLIMVYAEAKDELISRSAVIEIAMQYLPDDDGCCSKAKVDQREMLDEIENLPAIDVSHVEHQGNTSFISVKDVDDWKDRIILDEGDVSKRCKVYYMDGDPDDPGQ